MRCFIFSNMIQSHFFLALLWIVYCTLHSLLAALSVKLWIQKRMRAGYKYYRIAYTIFSFLGLIAILIYQFSISSRLLFSPPQWSKWLGLVVMIAGGLVMLLMIWKYFMQLSGIRWLTEEKMEARLEVKGLHRFVRHPLYMGTFLFLWGWFVFNPMISFFIATLIITIYTLIGLELEEKKLIDQFGDAYIEYKKKVPKLIPRLRYKMPDAGYQIPNSVD